MFFNQCVTSSAPPPGESFCLHSCSQRTRTSAVGCRWHQELGLVVGHVDGTATPVVWTFKTRLNGFRAAILR